MTERSLNKMVRTRALDGNALPVHSVRCAADVWTAAGRRAKYDGVTMSAVCAALVEGYAKGLIDLPRIQVVYSPTKHEDGQE